YGAVVSTPIDVHVESLESLRWNSTSARSAPPGPLLGFALRVTVPRRELPGASGPGSGGVVSIGTVAVCADSTLPATSVEKNEIVWTPSPETLTLVPLFQPPPSTAYWV